MDTDDLPSAFGPLLPYYPQSPPHLPLDTALYPQVVRDLLARQQGPQALDRGALVIGRGGQAPATSSLSIALRNDVQPAAKPRARSAPAPTLAKSRRKYTRSDRAKIRILHQHGKTVGEIAALVGAPPGTVRSIISNRRRSVEDDVAEDYEYVDEEFRGEYPPKAQTVVVDASNKRTKSPDVGAQHGREESPLTPLSSPEPEVPLMLALRAKKRKRRTEEVTFPTGDADSQSGGGDRETAAAVTDPRPIEGVRAPSTQCSTRSSLLGNVRETHKTDTPDFAHDFLADLDFELSAYHPALLACDLGRAQDVVPLRGWRAERLHLALEKAVPQLIVAERTALVRGIKGITKEGTIGKSVARQRLDEVAVIWTTPIDGFLASFPMDLSPCAEALRRAGITTLGRLLVIAGWSDDDLNIVFNEAGLDLKAAHRFVLLDTLKRFDFGESFVSVLRLFIQVYQPLAQRAAALNICDPSRWAPIDPRFFANLDHDLSSRTRRLAELGISTVVDMAALRVWEAGDLHRMLKEIVPELTVVERFVLVRGIQEGKAEGISQRGPLRLALDKQPHLWQRPAAQFLAKLDHDLSEHLPALTQAGMGFLGGLIALGHWSEDDMLALLKEAVPGMGVLRQMILIWGLRDEGERMLGTA